MTKQKAIKCYHCKGTGKVTKPFPETITRESFSGYPPKDIRTYEGHCRPCGGTGKKPCDECGGTSKSCVGEL